MGRLRFIVAIILARSAMFLSRLLKYGTGSSLPGVVALKICPTVLDYFSVDAKGIIMVTGTNGKTTTNNMIARVIEGSGYSILSNREGANMITGVTAAFIRGADLWGRVSRDYILLEVDEASFPKITRWLRPNMVVVTNFFRDQLDRYGELDKTVAVVADALKQLSDTTLVLNADDPLVAHLGAVIDLPVVYYGMDKHPGVSLTGSDAREAKFCPGCGAELDYQYYHYSQLGLYNCGSCGFTRPRPEVEAADPVEALSSSTCVVRRDDDEFVLNIPVRGLYNIYNALAACSVGMILGLEVSRIIDSLKQYIPATGRMEAFDYLGKRVLLNLVKNPTGFNEGLAGLTSVKHPCDVLIGINDNDADGRDVSWLWDVDFEMLQRGLFFCSFVCTGQRAAEMGVRLKYAGVPVELIIVEGDFGRAIDKVLKGEGETAFLLATYTALWPVEKILSRRARREYAHAERLSSVS